MTWRKCNVKLTALFTCQICGDVVKEDRVENGIQLCNTDWRRRVICG